MMVILIKMIFFVISEKVFEIGDGLESKWNICIMGIIM